MSKTKLSLESFLGDVELPITAEIGHTEMAVHELLNVKQGTVIPVGKIVGEPIDLFVSGQLLARGEVVIINDRYGIRIIDVPPSENAISVNSQAKDASS